MALGWRDADLTIIGFCGLPVANAAGVAAPLFKSGQRCFAGDPESPIPPKELYSEHDIGRLVNERWVTLTSRTFQWIPTGIFLYADQQFLMPSSDRCELYDERLSKDDRIGISLAYLSRDDAYGILEAWAHTLVSDAIGFLAGRPTTSRVLRAEDSAARALFCAKPPFMPTHRFDAFVMLAAAHLALGKSADRVYREARMDFDITTAYRIQQRAQFRAAGISAYPLADFRTGPDPADSQRVALHVRRGP